MVDSMTSNTAKDTDEILAKALNLFVQGKRHLLVRDYYSASQTLGEACELFDEKYGKCANEAGEVYLYYGTALLELARQETGALGGVVSSKIDDPSGSEVDDDDEEDEDDEDEGEEGGEKEADGNDKAESAEVNEKITDEEIDIAEENNPAVSKSPAEEPSSSAGPSSSSGPSSSVVDDGPSTSQGKSNVKTDEDAESDEANDLEISWDVLTMATMVFKRQLDQGKDVKLKLAESLQKMGEIAIEWENNEQAIGLLEESLEIRKGCLPDDDRLIAETYYHIGSAYSFMSQIEKANDCYRCAIDVIERRLEGKKKLVAETDDAQLKSDAEIEIIDLEAVLPDMRSKIEDSRDQMSTVMDALKKEECEKLLEKVVAEKIKEVHAKPVNNVSHLVKRKRPSDGESSAEAPKKRITLTAVPKTESSSFNTGITFSSKPMESVASASENAATNGNGSNDA